MASVSEIVSNDKFKSLSPLERMVSRKQLFDIELQENEELSAVWESADDEAKQGLRDSFRNRLNDSFPDVFKESEGAMLPVALLGAPIVQSTIDREELDDETKIKILTAVSEGFTEMKQMQAAGEVGLIDRLNLNAQDAFFGLETGIGTLLGAEFKAKDIGVNIFGRDKLVEAVDSAELSLNIGEQEIELRKSGERKQRKETILSAAGKVAMGLIGGETEVTKLFEARFGALSDEDLKKAVEEQRGFLEESRSELISKRGEGLASLGRKVGAFIALPESEGLAENTMALLGQLAGAIPSPENLVGGVAGFGTKTLVNRALIGAAENAVLNIITEPFVQAVATATGQQEGFNFQEALIRTGFGAALGGVFGAGSKKLEDFLSSAKADPPQSVNEVIIRISESLGISIEDAKIKFNAHVKKADPNDPIIKQVEAVEDPTVIIPEAKNPAPEIANVPSETQTASTLADQSLKPDPGQPRTPSIEGFNTKVDEPPRKDVTIDELNAVDPSEFINLKRLNVSQETQSIVEAQVKKTVAETGLSPKTKVSFDTIKAEAKALGILDPKMIDQNLIESTSLASRVAIRNSINSISNGLPQLYKQLDVAPTHKERLMLRASIGQAEFDLDQLIKINTGIRTADGRALASHRILADNVWDFQFWINKLKKEKGLTEDIKASDADAKELTDILSKGNQIEKDAKAKIGDDDPEALKEFLGNNKEYNETKKRLANLITDARETGWIETLTNLRKAGLLSSVRTHARNVLGTAGFQILDEISRVPAAIVDAALSKFTGERTVQGLSFKDFSAAAIKGSREGAKEAAQVLTGRSAMSDTELRKLETGRQTNFKKLGKVSPLVNAWINGNFKLLSAEDRFFKSIAADRSMREQASVISKNELKQGKITKDQLESRKQELLDNPSDAMIAESISAAEFMTFNNDGRLSTSISNLKSTLKRGGTGGQLANAVFEFFVPFSRTPTNIVARIIEATPAGTVINSAKTAKALIDGSMTTDIQREYAKALGRGAPGSALLALGAYLEQEGLATGQFNQGDPMNDVYTAAGRKPGSLLINGTWNQIVSLSPTGNLIALGAALNREKRREIEGDHAETKRVTNMTKAVTRNLLEIPVLKGIKDGMRALENPDTKFIRNLVNSYVPNIVNDVNILAGGSLREKPKNASVFQQVKEGIQEKLPFVSQGLPQRRLVTGEPVLPTPKTFVINPFLSTHARELEDKTLAELIRLEVPFRTLKQKLEGESEEGFMNRKVARGLITTYALDALINLPEYPSIPDEQKAEMLKSAISEYSRTVNGIMNTKVTDAEKLQALEDIKVAFRNLAPAPREEGQPPIEEPTEEPEASEK